MSPRLTLTVLVENSAMNDALEIDDLTLWLGMLEKVVDGLLRNAIEATPDEGKIEITVHPKGDGGELIVHDYGIGIVEELMAEHVARGGMLVMTSHHEVSMHRTAVHRLNLSA